MGGILWREVARRTGSALILVHHTKNTPAQWLVTRMPVGAAVP